MVVEHSFVTTMEAADALRAASAMLQELGFVAKAETAFALGSSWNALEVRRGNAKTRRNRGVHQWPQQVRVEWDRGKVDVAVAITPPPRARLDSNAAKLGKKERALVERLLFAVAQSLELLLARGVGQAEAQAALVQLDQEIEEQSRRERRRQTITLIVVLLLVIGAFGLMIYVAATSSPHHR